MLKIPAKKADALFKEAQKELEALRKGEVRSIAVVVPDKGGVVYTVKIISCSRGYDLPPR